jgi:hypothetical protein
VNFFDESRDAEVFLNFFQTKFFEGNSSLLCFAFCHIMSESYVVVINVCQILLCDVFASLISVDFNPSCRIISRLFFFYGYKLIFNLINLWYDFTDFLNSLFIPFHNLSGQISSFF